MLVNAGQTLTERAKISGRMEAIVDVATGARYDFRQLNERTNQVANSLLGLGLGAGDRVACLMSNQPRYAEAYFACAKAGYVFVALNWRLTVPELSYQLLDSGAAAVLYGADQLPLVEPLRAQFPHVRWLPADHGEFDAAVAAASTAEPPIGATGEDPLFMMYTSGTTGRPKGALLSHRANIAYLASMLATSDLNVDERQIIVAPMFHIAGLGLTMVAVYRGMTTVIVKTFDPGLMWDIVDQERITGFFAVPAMLAVHVPAPEARDGAAAAVALGHLRRGAGAGEPDRGLARDGRAGAPGLRRDGDARRHLPAQRRSMPPRRSARPGCPTTASTCGWSTWPATRCRRACRAKSSRAARTCSAGTGTGPRRRDNAIRDGWFHTGDIAEVDEDGFIYIKDRSKDMIISGGENVYPAEIENVLSSHPGVSEVGVIGQPSMKWGETRLRDRRARQRLDRRRRALLEELRALAQSRLARSSSRRRTSSSTRCRATRPARS